MGRKLIERTCLLCGTSFGARKSEVANGRGIYCGVKCRNSAMAKRKHQKHNQSGANNPSWSGGKEAAYMRAKESRDAWKTNNPKKVKCHRETFTAIRSGKLKPLPCEVCGKEQVDAHHDNYDEPLSVRWLCRTHHLKLHRSADGA